MGLWCTQMGVGAWIAMIIGWIAVLAVVVWAVCRMFPTAKNTDAGAASDMRRTPDEMDAATHQFVHERASDSADARANDLYP